MSTYVLTLLVRFEHREVDVAMECLGLDVRDLLKVRIVVDDIGDAQALGILTKRQDTSTGLEGASRQTVRRSRDRQAYRVNEDGEVPKLRVSLPQALQDGLHGGKVVGVGLYAKAVSFRLSSGRIRTYQGEDDVRSLRKTLDERGVLVRPDDALHAELLLELLRLLFGAHERGELERACAGVVEQTVEHSASDVA